MQSPVLLVFRHLLSICGKVVITVTAYPNRLDIHNFSSAGINNNFTLSHSIEECASFHTRSFFFHHVKLFFADYLVSLNVASTAMQSSANYFLDIVSRPCRTCRIICNWKFFALVACRFRFLAKPYSYNMMVAGILLCITELTPFFFLA